MVGQSPEIPTPFTALAPARPDLSEGVNLAYGPRSPVTLASLENIGTPIRPSATFVGDANSVPPHIRVQLQDAPLAPGQALPSATVQKDGSVLDSTGQVAIDANGVVKNQAFVTNPPMQSDLTIAVQRDVGQPVTTEAQQNVLNRLTDIWAKNIQTAYGDKLQTIQTTDGQSIRQVNIDDPSQLVSQAVEQKYGTGIPQDKIASTQPPVESGTEANPTPDISPATSGMAQRVNRDFPQGGSGQITGDQAGSYYPQRNVDRTAEGPDTDYLNTLSALAQQPVDHARHVPGGYKFGSYDTGPHIFGKW